MKATLSQADTSGGTLWVGDVLSANWDNDRGEFVIRGSKDSAALAGVISSLLDKQQLTIEIAGDGPGLLMWRGHVGSAKFQVSESEHVECCLTMLLDDWFGIFPESAIPRGVDPLKRPRLYPPLPPF